MIGDILGKKKLDSLFGLTKEELINIQELHDECLSNEDDFYNIGDKLKKFETYVNNLK